MNRFWIVITGVFLFFGVGCGEEDSPNQNDISIQKWLSTSGIKATRDNNGIYFYAESINSTGDPVSSGNILAVYYKIYDLEDNLIVSHQRPQDSLIFKYNAGAVYPAGVDLSIGRMKTGDIYSFILPPEVGYIFVTDGSFDQNGIYRLQIELVASIGEKVVTNQEEAAIKDYIIANKLNNTIVNPLDSVIEFAGGLRYKRLLAGFEDVPIAGDTVVVDYTGTFLTGGIFDTMDDFSWIFESNAPRPLVSGFKQGISLMQQGERALLILPSSEAYRESALVIPNSITNNLIENEIIPDYVAVIPPYQALIFNITRED